MKINFNDNTIELTAKESKVASIYGSDAYRALIAARADFPTFSIIVKTASHKGNYKGLDYNFMEAYIKTHDEDGSILKVFYEKCGRDEKGTVLNDVFYDSYTDIKHWFFETYPDVKGKRIRSTKSEKVA